MLTREEIAARLNVSTDVLRKTVETRRDYPKPVLRLSRKTVRWSEDDIERWLKKQATVAA
jgi:predicted DNA-binding transcriptional regulator AlpA